MRGLFIMPTTCSTRTQSFYLRIQAYLKSQICRVRTEEKPFKCPVCIKYFNQNSGWEDISEYIHGSNYWLVHCAKRHLVLHHLSVCTQGFIQGKSHFAVHCVRSPTVNLLISENTQESTQGKNHLSVQCVRNPSEIQNILRYT